MKRVDLGFKGLKNLTIASLIGDYIYQFGYSAKSALKDDRLRIIKIDRVFYIIDSQFVIQTNLTSHF
jgi:hypothetical protein